MPPASRAKYRRAARYHHSGMSQVEALMKSKVYTSLAAANSNAYKLFKRDGTGNPNVIAELERCEAVEFDQAVLSKKEKLEASATITRGIQDKIEAQLDNEDEETEIDHKLLDSYIKMGKRDDQLQGHAVLAETNPQDKADALLSGWVLEAQKNNEEKRMKKVDIVDI